MTVVRDSEPPPVRPERTRVRHRRRASQPSAARNRPTCHHHPGPRNTLESARLFPGTPTPPPVPGQGNPPLHASNVYQSRAKPHSSRGVRFRRLSLQPPGSRFFCQSRLKEGFLERALIALLELPTLVSRVLQKTVILILPYDLST